MNSTLLARKGEAVPSGSDRHALAYFAGRRTVTFGQAVMEQDIAPPRLSAPAAPERLRPAARIFIQSRQPKDARRRFTFRLDDETHDRFCAAARMLGCSRQKLLERALERFVDVLDGPMHLPVKSTTAVPRLV